jgi:hypothetical protein
MPAHVKRYLVQFSTAMAGYMVLLFGSVYVLEAQEFPAGVRAALALLPVLPALYAFYAVIVFYRALDEFQRRVISEAMIGAALFTGFASFSYGFLEGSLDLPVIPMIWVFPAMIGLYGVFACLLKWYYK